MTYADLEDRYGPETRVELIRGEPYLLTSQGFDHQFAVTQMGVALAAYAGEHEGWTALVAPMDLKLADDTVLQPDALMVSAEAATLRSAPFLTGADLVVEVLSPAAAGRDWITKRDIYERYDIPEYWLVDVHARTVTTQVLGEDGAYGEARVVDADGAVEATVVSGLVVPVARLLA